MRPRRIAVKASLLYAAFGTLWILVSDWSAGLFSADAGMLQTTKGLAFVAITTLVVYWLTRRIDLSMSMRQATFDASPVALYSIDPDGNVLTWNKGAESIFGWSEKEVIGQPLPIVPEDKLDEFADLRERTRNGDMISGLRVIRQRKDGSLFPGRLSTAGIMDGSGNLQAIMGSLEDVTLQERAEETIKESEDRFRTLVESAPDAILVQMDVRFAYVNDACVRLFEAGRPEDLLGMQVIKRIHPRDRAKARNRMRSLIKEGKPVREERQTIITLNGNFVPVESIAVPIRYQGKDAGLGLVRDVSRREQDAIERQRLFQAIEQTHDAIIITDTRGIIEYVNPAFERVTGYSSDEAVGYHADLQRSGVHDAAFFRNMWQTIESGNVWRSQIVNRHKDGTLYTEDVSITPVFDASGEIINFVGVQRDVTREIQLENQLQQSQRIGTVGRLAGGVAHDFNNMLSVIQGYTELAMESLAASDPARNDLQEVKTAAEKSARLTKQLLGFARQQPIEPEVLDLNEAIPNVLNMLEPLIGEDIELVWQPSDGLWPVRVDPGQIDQILMNLAVNARDAISQHGTFVIGTSNVEITDIDCRNKPGLQPGRYVQLTVRDDGVGMDESIQSQVFEPFFTTKSGGQGTGLGLSTVYGIVKQNEGYIDLQSSRDRGTTFKIYLPPYEPEGVQPARQPEAAPRTDSSHAMILLVEDQEALLRLTERMLKKQGYEVLATRSPSDAVKMANEHRGAIDLLLTDVVMPEMSGTDLWQTITEIAPNVRVLFASGYIADTYIHEVSSGQTKSFIQKPYSAASLSAKINEVLQS